MDLGVPEKNFSKYAFRIAEKLMEVYWGPLYKYLEANTHLLETFTALLLEHDKLVFYFGKTHLAIEYFGRERLQQPTLETLNRIGSARQVHLQVHDLTLSDGNFIEQIIGFKYDSTAPIRFPLPPFAEDLILPTNRGLDELLKLRWNFAAQNSMTLMNSGDLFVPEGQFSRFTNALFFDANENGLKTRHIKWIDFVPLKYDDTDKKHDFMSINIGGYKKLVKGDAAYVYPLPDSEDYKYTKLPQVNRFIELAGDKDTTEPTITAFLNKNENKFILTMSTTAKEIHHQLKCEWQSVSRDPIIPDFFVVRPNGYADIVEFKLPHLKSTSIVGKQNRETFSAEINAYISQTRTYKSYFDDPNNRKWFEDKYGFKVRHPRRILVLGRRWDFSSDEWKDIIADYKDVDVMTYDEGVIQNFAALA